MAINAELREQVDGEIMSKAAVTSRDMMGTTAYMVRGRMFAFWVADGLVAKLPSRTMQEMIERNAAALFQGPQGRGSGEWTNLHLEKKSDLEPVQDGIKAAYEYVRGAASAKQKRSKGRKK